MADAKKSLIEVRCKYLVKKKYHDRPEEKIAICNALLAKVSHGQGQIRCWRCKQITDYDVQRSGVPSLV